MNFIIQDVKKSRCGLAVVNEPCPKFYVRTQLRYTLLLLDSNGDTEKGVHLIEIYLIKVFLGSSLTRVRPDNRMAYSYRNGKEMYAKTPLCMSSGNVAV